MSGNNKTEKAYERLAKASFVTPGQHGAATSALMKQPKEGEPDTRSVNAVCAPGRSCI
jgi:hypothetical protein